MLLFTIAFVELVSDMPGKVSLPIEIKKRELNGKLLLSLALANNGYKVAIGQIGRIKNGMDIIKPDIHIVCNALYSNQKRQLFAELSRHGCTLALLDTEGGIFPSSESYRERLSDKILPFLDIYFAWGSRSAEIFPSHRFPEIKNIISGNPRFDLLSQRYRAYYKKEEKEIKEELGEYIIFCTNFGVVNHFDGDLRRDINEKHNIEQTHSEKSNREAVFHQYISAIEELSREVTVVVRPHPTENHSSYIEKFRDNDNVQVRSEGESIPWILGSRAMIHRNSTTGIESLLLDKPTRTYDPIPNGISSNIAYQISPKVTTLEDLISFAREPCDNKGANLDLLNEYIHTNVESIKEIRNSFEQLEINSKNEWDIRPTKKEKIRRKLAKWRLLPLAKKAQHVISDDTKKEYSNQKFKKLTEEEVLEKLDKMASVSSFNRPDVNPIPALQNCYWLE